MKKILSVLALLVVATVVCFSSISVSAASRKSPVATTTRPRHSNTNPSAPTGNPGGGDGSNTNPTTVNPEDDSSEWFRTSTTVPYDPNDPNDPNNPNYNGGNNGDNGSNTSPVTGDYVVYSVLIAAGLGLSSLFAYKKYTSKKK